MEDYLQRLANHANMANTLPEENSLLYCLWQAEKSGKFPDIEPMRADVLQCLQEANVDVNGPIPSEAIGTSDNISSSLALCACEIVQGCYEYALIWERHSLFTLAERETLKQTAWMILCGWCYTLPGDIDDIQSQILLSGEIKEIL